MKKDLKVWVDLLDNHEQGTLFLQTNITYSEEIKFYTDAAGSGKCGWGCVFDDKWMYGQWPEGFVEQTPFITFLELYALVLAVVTWKDKLKTCRVVVHCDNMSVVHMVNQQMSRCQKCMALIRVLVLEQMRSNFKIGARYLSTKENSLADALSHLQVRLFRTLYPNAHPEPSQPASCLYPPSSNIWNRL